MREWGTDGKPCNLASTWTCRLAVLLLTLLCTPVMAESLRIVKAVQDVKQLFTATKILSLDLGRPPMSSEWPDILVDAPALESAWRGPYAYPLRDPWGNPYRLRDDLRGPETFGIYSVGVNGRDEGGSGDDVSSWGGYDSRFYHHSGRLLTPGDWRILIGATLLLAMLLGSYLIGRHVIQRRRSSARARDVA